MRSTQHPTTGIDSNEPGNAPESQQQRVLIVEDDSVVREVIEHAIATPQRRVYHAADLAQAREILNEQAIDLALIDLNLPDGKGVELARDIRAGRSHTRSIIITGQATLDHAVDALRCGATDFVSKPLNIDELNERIASAMKLQSDDVRRRHQFDRLRGLCKRLNLARREITEQVDILCNDLVTAYQELANQVNKIEVTNELREKLDDELDLEQVLRRTMEHLLDKIGAANVIVFLPSSSGGFSVGGYVNYSYEKEEISVLMQQLADDAAERLMEQPDTLLLTDDEQLADELDITHSWLDGMHVLATPCLDCDGEPLAGIMLFRPADEPFDAEDIEQIDATAPTLTDHLIKVIRVHHRAKDLFEDGPDNLAA